MLCIPKTLVLPWLSSPRHLSAYVTSPHSPGGSFFSYWCSRRRSRSSTRGGRGAARRPPLLLLRAEAPGSSSSSRAEEQGLPPRPRPSPAPRALTSRARSPLGWRSAAFRRDSFTKRRETYPPGSVPFWGRRFVRGRHQEGTRRRSEHLRGLLQEGKGGGGGGGGGIDRGLGRGGVGKADWRSERSGAPLALPTRRAG